MRNLTSSLARANFTVCLLASGSKGNAIYISNGQTAILVDAGLSGKEIERRMHARGLTPEALSAIVVSHEHIDHVRGVGVLSRRYKLPVYISSETLQKCEQIGRLSETRFFQCGFVFKVHSLAVRPFSTTHDAIDPAGFIIEHHGIKLGIATDLGRATALVKNQLKDCNVLIIEANHDPEMLMNGPYPWHLKQRIKGRNGHLSNEDTQHLLKEIRHTGLCHVVLAHLSEVNNTPDKALECTRKALASSQCNLSVSSQDEGTDLIIF
jgi:phosphoribosyl 1,2-cyclic phosphodiesterase